MKHIIVASLVTYYLEWLLVRDRPRFFDQLGHQTTNASIGNKYFLLNNVIIRLAKIMIRADKNWAHLY